jgi:hypothetical protein
MDARSITGKDFIMWRFNYLPGWATPNALRNGYAALASALHHRDTRGQCLPRRQGRCPGLEYCADCSWKEGTSREHG